MKQLLLLLGYFLTLPLLAQTGKMTWWNPATHHFPVLEGQAWSAEVPTDYARLPTRIQDQVTPGLWSLSHHSAGLMLRFRSNAEEIVIRYQAQWNPQSAPNPDRYGMPHMPPTGVAGVDLYAISSDGEERWCAGRYQFGDTITYRFHGLTPNDRYHQQGREYRLYLPLYHQVKWLEIGVEKAGYFEPLAVRPEKPIVVYGTSIAQGACASRPGMAWTAILGRKLDRPLVNLGFSGMGRLESPLIELMTEIDAKAYVLDCLPNLTRRSWERVGISDGSEIKNRVLQAVRELRKARPTTPILLVDHAGYSEASMEAERAEVVQEINALQREAFQQLLREGVPHLYDLSQAEINLPMDGTVDGTHPSDLGMQAYADAYERKLRQILHEPVGTSSTTQPVVQAREPGNYDWEGRHRDILAMNSFDPPKQVILANSIIHFWGGQPRSAVVREAESWEAHFTPLGLANYAYGWDRIENVLWRVYHGELDGFEAERVLIMIGTNNLHLNTDEEIIAGLDLLVQAIQQRQPMAEVVLMGILPRGGREARVRNLNSRIARLASERDVSHADLGEVFLLPDQAINQGLFSDGLHPNAAGYRALRPALLELLR
ncbi:MAG: SGNH/GDSL hydrolase family protein [Bacteroidota bacterium]